MSSGENQAAAAFGQRSRDGIARYIRGLSGGRRLLLGLPALFAAAYLILLAVDFSPVISGINTYGDAVIAPVLGKLAGHAPAGSRILLGHHAYYEEFLFLRATAGLPFYRELWELAPMLWTLLGFGILGWAAWRALGRFAALISASAVVCLGNLGRFSFFALDWHGLTVLHTILLGAALVWLAPRAEQIRWSRLALAAVSLGLISALPVASDPLFLEWALVPMGLATASLARRASARGRRTLGVFTLVTAIVSLIAGSVIADVMRAGGVGTTQFTYPLLATAGGMVSNLKMLFEGLTALGGGFFFRMSLNLAGFMTLLSGVLILAALMAGVTRGLAVLRGDATARPATREVSTAATGYVSFWLSSLILQSIVFVVTGIPKQNLDSSRYLLAGYIAIMALIPLVARRGRRWRMAVTVGVCAFAASSIFQLARRPFVEYGPYPTAPIAQRMLAFARAHGVRYGYASYWEGPDLTWLTDFKLQIYPVRLGCGASGICPWGALRLTAGTGPAATPDRS